jgi:hypothetical protein
MEKSSAPGDLMQDGPALNQQAEAPAGPGHGNGGGGTAEQGYVSMGSHPLGDSFWTSPMKHGGGD